MENDFYIKINPSTKELEAKFPVSEWDKFSPYIIPSIEYFNASLNKALPVSVASSSPAPIVLMQSENVSTGTFGEFLNMLNLDKDVDRVLAAGYFLQQKSQTKDFLSAEVTAILKEQGFAPSNTTAFINRNRTVKRLFKTEGNRFRISAQGEEHLKSLLIGDRTVMK